MGGNPREGKEQREGDKERRESTVLGLVLGSNSAHFTAKLFQKSQPPQPN